MPDRAGPARWMPLLRIAFLAAVVGFTWFGLRGRFDEVGDALARTSPLRLAGALGLVLLGLLATSVLWRLLMRALDAALPTVDGSAIFFIGQLGKYIPGSVWSLGAQADLARRHDVAPRTTVAAGLLFLGYHVDTAVLVAAVTDLAGGLDSPWPSWVSWLASAVALLGLLPAVVRELARRIAGRAVVLDLGSTAVVVALMAFAWAAYAGALVLLSPAVGVHDYWLLGGAFAAAYAVGVVIVLAPAGVGAREGVFVLLLQPTTGVAAATALALLARVVHTVADGLLAAAWWAAARRSRT